MNSLEDKTYTITVTTAEKNVVRFVEDWIGQESGFPMERKIARALSQQINMPLEEGEIRVHPSSGMLHTVDYVGGQVSMVTNAVGVEGVIDNEELSTWVIYWTEVAE